MKIKYALKAILSNKLLSIVLIIELICGYYSFYNILDFQKQINEQTKKVNFIYGNVSVYSIRLKTTGIMGFKDNEKLLACIKELQTSKDYKFTIGKESDIRLKKFRGFENFKAGESSNCKIDNVEYVYANSFAVNENAVKSFDLQVQEGRLFDENEYSKGSEDNIYPVVLGANYKGYYKVGDVIDGLKLEEDIGAKFKVVGILERSASMPLKFDYNSIFFQSEKGSPNFVNLDNYIVRPFFDDASRNTADDMFFWAYRNFAILDKNYSEEKKEKILNDIKDKLENATEEKFIITSYDKIITKQLDQYINSRNTYLYTSITVLIFLSITIIVGMLNSINKRKKEFGVYISSGARMKDIMRMIGLQMILISVIALIFTAVTILIYYHYFDGDALMDNPYIKVKSLDFKALAVLLFGGVAYSAIASLIPIRKIKKLNISDLLRRDD
ncbi:ABC transporter permease [Inconstantimicrobium mannanitabidum]|uniref:Uncharacterized protein n=1 Tax=Inconstantimicrobium mannanitabidum TaxID=1604901 RepID=A0ACB5RFD6_9CLOT|nr:ABC transporter permease [Clostridium sp. TW13]GKX67744.1 hypothetical protein rsdtw13_30020 [Clostridium sp. TW13]